MQVKCEYCGSFIDENHDKCPSCGAVNPNFNRKAKGAPKTIEELKEWYVYQKLPDEKVTRFFIGKDVKDAKAFGIYKDEQSGIVTVYKNKANGERAVRYEGKDEAYGVNEIYLKLKEEIQSQKAMNENRRVSKKKRDKNDLSWLYLMFIVVGVFVPPLILVYLVCYFILTLVFKKSSRLKEKFGKRQGVIAGILTAIFLFVGLGVSAYISRNDGYYRVGTDLYNKRGNDWYYYNGYDYVETYDPFGGSYEEYRVDDSEIDYEESFENSRFYEENFNSSDSDSFWDWDSDSSWDSSDSWDSGGSDWDSDW